MTTDQMNSLINAVRSIAHGELSGPAGLEGLGIALAGYQLETPVGEALKDLAAAVREHADAVSEAAAVQADAIMSAVNAIIKAITDQKVT